VVEPEHYEKAFEIKPRARTMVYRDWLVKLSPVVHSYVAFLCQKQRATMSVQIQQLYTLARQIGETEFVAAVELAAEQEAYGVEYLMALTSNLKTAGSTATVSSIPVYSARNGLAETTPKAVTVDEAAWWLSQLPGQTQVARPLDHYEILVANRHQLHLEFNEPGEATAGTNTNTVTEGGR
jgi:hypothetical protein